MSTSVFDDVDDHDDFVPDPPPPFDDRDYAVAHVVSMFEQASRPEPAWALSTALHSLETNCFKRDRRPLTADERLTVLAAIERAYRMAWSRLPAPYPRSRIFAGMRGAATLVELWHRPRKLERNDALYDAKASARLFRNDMHNFCLLDEMRERAQRRELFGVSAPFAADPPALAFVDSA